MLDLGRWEHLRQCYNRDLDYLFLLSNLTTLLLILGLPHFTQPHQCLSDSFSLHFASIVHLCTPFHIYRFIRLTYLMPRFTSYCMYHSTLDPVPIRLVVDRPLWTSFVYIRRPLLR